MLYRTLTLGLLHTNCLLLWNERRDGLLIDPGAEPEMVLGAVRDHGIQLAGILLTHAHPDHIAAVPAVTAALGVPVVLHPDDVAMYHSKDNCLLPWLPRVEELPETVPELAAVPEGLAFQMLHTPGHSPGSVCYYFAESANAFVGDTLFQSSVGRTDLPGGDWETMAASIRDVLFALPDEVTAIPGHGPETSIGEEKRHNPYLKQA